MRVPTITRKKKTASRIDYLCIRIWKKKMVGIVRTKRVGRDKVRIDFRYTYRTDCNITAQCHVRAFYIAMQIQAGEEVFFNVKLNYA